MITTETATKVHRVDLPCTFAGFQAPPCHVHLRFERAEDHWRLVARTAPNAPMATARWLEAHGPTRLVAGPGIAPKEFRADFDELPTPWQELLSKVQVQHIDITPGGIASLFIEGSEGEVDTFVSQFRTKHEDVRAREASPKPAPEVTPRQMDALSTAVALGYYEIPRRVDLRTLGKAMGVSLGSISELLRRAEDEIITGYVDALAAARWRSQDNEADDGDARRAAAPGATGGDELEQLRRAAGIGPSASRLAGSNGAHK